MGYGLMLKKERRKRMRTKWLQRVMAIALTMAMCLTNGSFGNLGGIEVVKADETNLLTNGDFETDIWSDGCGWTVTTADWANFGNGSISTTTEKKNSGDSALGIWFENDGTSVTLSQNVELEAGNYELSGYAMEKNGKIASVEFEQAGNSLTTTTDFAKFTGTVNLASAGTYTIKVKVSGNNGAWVVLDDVTMKRTGDYIPPAYTYDDLRNLIASIQDTTEFS